MTRSTRPANENASALSAPGSDPGQPGSAAGAANLPNPDGETASVSWLRQMGRFLGACVLRVCSQGRKECTNAKCWLQPVCACARADLAAARRAEARIWLIILVCGAVVLAVALLRPHG